MRRGAEPGRREQIPRPASYTPKHLAGLTSPSAFEGERKQVTVLFVDVSGFTSLSEQRAVQRAGEGWVLTRRVADVVIPDTIQDVITARIDRLEEAPKKTLQLASVIGREFTLRLLDRIADLRGRTEEFLRELKALELPYAQHARLALG